MKLEAAKAVISKYIGQRFSCIFPKEVLHDLKTDKGIVGKLLETTLGLNHTSDRLDFEDGELKTNKCEPDGAPRETMFVLQLSSIIDDVLAGHTFRQTPLCRKISNLLYVPVCKDGPATEWMFLPPIHFVMGSAAYVAISAQLEQDYYSIGKQLAEHIRTSSDGFIHTSNGLYLQVRSKDAKPYNPIFSRTIGRNVSNKNHAFYFQKSFMHALQDASPEYPYSP